MFSKDGLSGKHRTITRKYRHNNGAEESTSEPKLTRKMSCRILVMPYKESPRKAETSTTMSGAFRRFKTKVRYRNTCSGSRKTLVMTC